MDLFRALEKNLGKLDVIAEDLWSPYRQCDRDGGRIQIPGMKVLQFAFDENEDNPYLTH